MDNGKILKEKWVMKRRCYVLAITTIFRYLPFYTPAPIVMVKFSKKNGQ